MVLKWLRLLILNKTADKSWLEQLPALLSVWTGNGHGVGSQL